MWINSYGLNFCDNYFVPFALYCQKIIQRISKILRFWKCVFQPCGDFNFKIFFCKRNQGEEGEKGRGGEGRMGRRDGVFQSPPLQNVLLRPCTLIPNSKNTRIVYYLVYIYISSRSCIFISTAFCT